MDRAFGWSRWKPNIQLMRIFLILSPTTLIPEFGSAFLKTATSSGKEYDGKWEMEPKFVSGLTIGVQNDNLANLLAIPDVSLIDTSHGLAIYLPRKGM